MKMKEKTKWYFLIAVALIVGALIGYFATTKFSTTGNAIRGTTINSEMLSGVDLKNIGGHIGTACFCDDGEVCGYDMNTTCDICCNDGIWEGGYTPRPK